MNTITSHKANCKNCYKCLRVCPVKSIRFTNGQAEIIQSQCIYCGACVISCPQQAKSVESHLKKVKEFIKNGDVVLSLAPSFLGAFDTKNPMKIVTALRKLGFCQIRETAEGAAVVSDEIAKIAKEGKMDNIITTCCPGVNNLIEKHFPNEIPALSPIVSPMIAHGKMIKHQLGKDIKVVFAGPCIAKIEESKDIRHDNCIDAVLTFEELADWLCEENIDVNECEENPFDGQNGGLSKMYPTNAGILRNVKARGVDNYKLLHIDGVDQCMDFLEAMEKGQIHNCIIEMNVCKDSCMGGPKNSRPSYMRFDSSLAVKEYAKNDEVVVADIKTDISLHKEFIDKSKTEQIPTEEELRQILRSIGKETKLDELNCGSCGYATCREKAVAVFQHKAEVSMCMPYMYQSAQSMSNVILDNTPNMIIVVDSDFKINEINAAGRAFLGLTRSEAMERYLYEFMDTTDFQIVLDNEENIIDMKISLDHYGKSFEQTLVYLPKQRAVMGIFKDISEDEKKERDLYNLRLETMNMAQKVIDKQMIAAQEIASLLGETTAETKSTLTSLKNMIINNGETEK